jgi:hypothetical protein
MADVIELAEMRKKLRPPPAPEPFISSLMRTLASIDAAYEAKRHLPNG